jgi:ubiquinone/menaquinone biosynthesis C-methylase UbiE
MGDAKMNGEVSADLQASNMLSPRRESKSEHVRRVFENTPHYLKNRGVDIQFRVETVGIFAGDCTSMRLLDIGCGDGSISTPLLKDDVKLTLLDLSTNMLATAAGKVPADLSKNVELRNENFMEASFGPEPFDLIVTVGVMAHVDSPDEFVAKIKSLLRPGGRLIIEFTDSRHFVGEIGRFWGRMKELVAPSLYSTNRLSFGEVSPLFKKHNLKLISTFRYSRIPLPGVDRTLSHDFQFRLAKRLFGKCTSNRNAWLGNEYICLLEAE